jgi:hypothetical protein
MVEGTNRTTVGKGRSEKSQHKASRETHFVDKELVHLKQQWTERKDQLKSELVELQKDPRYIATVKDLMNIIKALEVRERLLDAKETSVIERERYVEGQKDKLSQQAEKLAQLRNELEMKIGELEARLAALEDTE